MLDLIVSVPDHCLSFYFKRGVKYPQLRFLYPLIYPAGHLG